jgi:nicotinamidase/pyrazinamidase
METFTADRIVSITVDVQNDFCEGGSLAVTHASEIIIPINDINHYIRMLGGIAIFTGDQHPEKTRHFDIWPMHCVAGTEGAVFNKDLVIHADDVIINKGMGQTNGYSGFEGISNNGQTIESIIQPIGTERVAVLIQGLATDYCDLNTALDALKVDKKNGTIRVYVLEDAMRAVNLQPDDGKKAIEAMRMAGAIITTSTTILTNQAIELAN